MPILRFPRHDRQRAVLVGRLLGQRRLRSTVCEEVSGRSTNDFIYNYSNHALLKSILFRFLDEFERQEFNRTSNVQHLVAMHNHFVGREVSATFTKSHTTPRAPHHAVHVRIKSTRSRMKTIVATRVVPPRIRIVTPERCGVIWCAECINQFCAFPTHHGLR